MWQSKSSFTKTEYEPIKFVFLFEDLKEKKRVLDKCPWYVNEGLLVLKEIPPNTLTEEINLATSELWVQAHGLLMELLNMDNAEMIRKMVELNKNCNSIFSSGVQVPIFSPLLLVSWRRNLKILATRFR